MFYVILKKKKTSSPEGIFSHVLSQLVYWCSGQSELLFIFLHSYFRDFASKLSLTNNINEFGVSCNRNSSTSETEGGGEGGGGDITFCDMVSVTANAGSFEVPSSFDDGYDSSNSFPHSPGKYIISFFE